MRTDAQFKAEILRRSEERVKQRKKIRRQTAAGCIPVLLCVLVLLVWLWPQKPPAVPDQQEPSRSEPSQVTSDVLVEVKNGEALYRRYTDPDKIIQIINACQSAEDANPLASQVKGEDTADRQLTGYTVAVTSVWGDTATYYITTEDEDILALLESLPSDKEETT